MTQRLVAVGDDFTLPAAVKVADGNLPNRLSDGQLTATYAPISVASKVINPDDAGYDLIILAGQSNTAGRGVVDAKIDITDPRIFQFGAQGSYGNVISQAADPLAQVETSGTGLGFGTTFARWYANTVPANRRVLLVPTAKGGTTFEGASSPAGWTWKVGRVDVTNLYENAITQAQAALAAAGPNSRISAILWLQGETDGDNATSGATYQTDLDALIDGFRTRLGISDLPFIIGQMVPDYLSTGTRTAIDAVHSGTPARKAKTGFAYGLPKANNNDGNHYNAAGQRYLGRAIFDAYRSVITGTAVAAPGQVTGLAAGTPGATSVALSWSRISSALAYVVEYRTSPSGSWIMAASTSTNKATVAGLTPSTAYDFRVTARNAAGAGTVSASVTATTTTIQPLLNTVTATAARAYSMRKLRTAYAGSAIRVRRSSDSTEQDIGFVSGNLDTAALLTFAGAGSAYVKTWYDQSGNGLDMTQATAAAQPRIVLNGALDTVNGQPTAVFDGTASYFTATAASLYAAGAASVLTVLSGTAGQTSARIVAEGSSSSANPQYAPLTITAGTGTDKAAGFIRNDANTVTLADSGGGSPSILTGTAHQVSTVDNGASMAQYADGTNSKTDAYTRSGTLTMDRLAIGAMVRTTVSSYFAGQIPELVIWTAALSTADRQAGEGNQKAFYGTP